GGLDLDRAIARVTYRMGDATFRREVFASAVDQVLVVRLACDRPGRISFSATLGRDQDGRVEAEAPDRAILRGEAIARDERHPDENRVGVRFVAVLRAIPEGGKVRAAGDHVEVQGADTATLLLAVATDFRSREPAEDVDRALAAAERPYDQLRARHVRDHQALFRRVELELGDGEPVAGSDPAGQPTDRRLARLRRGEADPSL